MRKSTNKPGAGRPPVWTERQEKILREKYSSYENESIAKQIGVTVSALRNKALKMGLKKDNRIWTEEQEMYLLKHIEKESYEDIAAKLNRTFWAVVNKYRELTNKR